MSRPSIQNFKPCSALARTLVACGSSVPFMSSCGVTKAAREREAWRLVNGTAQRKFSRPDLRPELRFVMCWLNLPKGVSWSGNQSIIASLSMEHITPQQ
jgi:hypothetical protein